MNREDLNKLIDLIRSGRKADIVWGASMNVDAFGAPHAELRDQAGEIIENWSYLGKVLLYDVTEVETIALGRLNIRAWPPRRLAVFVEEEGTLMFVETEPSAVPFIPP